MSSQSHSDRWEHQYYPTYFFPHGALSENYLRPSKDSDSGNAYDLVVGDTVASKAVTKYPTGDAENKDVAGLLKITFSAVNAWFEEDEQIFVHAKDPYKASFFTFCCLAD